MAKFIINKKYVPTEQNNIAQLFLVLARSSKAEDIEAVDDVLKVLSAQFPSAVLINSSLVDEELLTEDLSETQQNAWLDNVLPSWSAFVQQQQREFNVESVATALVGVGHLGSLVLELAKKNIPLAGRLIVFGGRFISLPQEPISLDQTLHLFHAANDKEVDAKHSHIAKIAIDNLDGDCTVDLVQGLDDSLDPNLISQMRVRLQSCIPLRIIRQVQAADK